MIRTIFSYVIFLCTTVILGTVAIFLSLFDSSGNIPHLVARLWGKIPLRTTGIKVSVLGRENIDPQKSYILVSNHQSNFDIFALLGYLPIQFRWIAMASLFRILFCQFLVGALEPSFRRQGGWVQGCIVGDGNVLA